MGLDAPVLTGQRHVRQPLTLVQSVEHLQPINQLINQGSKQLINQSNYQSIDQSGQLQINN